MSNYFTRDLQDSINEMSQDEMSSVLLSLEATEYWIAILKYTQLRMGLTKDGLMIIDPIAKATEMCRMQGILMGQTDLQNAVILLKEKAIKNAPQKTDEE